MNKATTTYFFMSIAIGSGVGMNSAAALEVDSDVSSVNLVSTKVLADGTASVSELFSFNSLAGSVTEDGSATVSIDLGVVQTGIDIRNERMRDYLFETSQYPEATITAQVPESVMGNGSHLIDLDVDVDMHGSQMSYTVPVMVISDERKIMVVASQPLLVDAASFDLQGGLGKLGELAGLLHIPTTVPVTFNLAFNR